MAVFYQFDVYACETTPPYSDVAKLGTITVPVVEGNLTPKVADVSGVDISAALANASAHTPDTSNLGNALGHRTGTFDNYMQNLVDIAPRTQVITDVFENYKDYYLKIKNASGYYGVSTSKISYYGASINILFDKNGNQIAVITGFNGLPFMSNTNVSNIVVESIQDGQLQGETCSVIGYGTGMSGDNATYSVFHSYNISKDVLRWFNGLESGVDDDPYKPGGNSGVGGGTGTFDGTGDAIEIPGLPTLSATDTGFITLFNPAVSQLKALANYMWSNGFDIQTFKKIFADPMDCILGLSIVPVAVPNGDTGEVSVGNISTGISMTKAAAQYVSVDCGTLNVQEFWGGYLDYDPYTKAEIYLPYIGTHPISVDDIMNKSVHVVYHVDILSGACTAFVKCGSSVLYEFIGQCSSSIPISGNDWTNVINGVLTVAGSIGTMVATGGATAPMVAGTIASTAVNSMKPNVEKSGSMSGTGGMLAIQTPYLILTRPRQAKPKNQNKFTGYPSFITEKLGSISGYTEIESVHLENIPATEQELSEIENLLKSGVIF